MLKWVQSALIGLLLGLSCTYIIMSLNVYHEVERVVDGKFLLQQAVLGAGLGIAIGLVSRIFSLEKPILVLLIIHYAAVNSLVFLFGMFGNWFEQNLASIFELIFTTLITYVIVWAILLVLVQRDVSEINSLLKERSQ
ncbi:DUF3021 family protein [Solibacillus sp. FSL H8-0538]|uniref:DUF3021 family protein n=1 Tax=Solibacillus sp. FSL H8-0538 TaxID=2921400 RepID=UPI0030FC33FF